MAISVEDQKEQASLAVPPTQCSLIIDIGTEYTLPPPTMYLAILKRTGTPFIYQFVVALGQRQAARPWPLSLGHRSFTKGAIVSGHRFSPLDRSIHGKIPSGTPFVEASRKGGAGFLDHAVVRLNKLLYPTHSRPIAVPSVLPLTQIHVLKQPRGGTFATKDPMFCYHIIKLQKRLVGASGRNRSFPGLGTCQS